jgi:hypothetical protein
MREKAERRKRKAEIDLLRAGIGRVLKNSLVSIQSELLRLRTAALRVAGAWDAFIPAKLILAVVLVAVGAVSLCGAETSSRTIGIEGRTRVVLPGKDYRPRPLDDRTELILRIESLTPSADGKFAYEFSYIGLEPGPYNLTDYLVRPDGTRPDELGNLPIEVRSNLPAEHDGQLNAYVPRPFPWIGGYRVFLGMLLAAWVGGIVALTLVFRKKHVVALPPPVPVLPTFADLLRPLVESAAAGQLAPDGQAQLERLMMGYWRDRLKLPELRMAEALSRLKSDAQAGELLRALERWLHRRGGVPQSEVAAVLEPYRHAPAVNLHPA